MAFCKLLNIHSKKRTTYTKSHTCDGRSKNWRQGSTSRNLLNSVQIQEQQNKVSFPTNFRKFWHFPENITNSLSKSIKWTDYIVAYQYWVAHFFKYQVGSVFVSAKIQIHLQYWEAYAYMYCMFIVYTNWWSFYKWRYYKTYTSQRWLHWYYINSEIIIIHKINYWWWIIIHLSSLLWSAIFFFLNRELFNTVGSRNQLAKASEYGQS